MMWSKFSSAKLKELREDDTPALVFCGANWDTVCEALDNTLFADPRIPEAMLNWMSKDLTADQQSQRMPDAVVGSVLYLTSDM